MPHIHRKFKMKDPRTTSIRYIKGIGPRRAQIFFKRGIMTVEDLLYYFPRRYEDRACFSPIAGLKENQVSTVKGTVIAGGLRSSWRRSSFRITEVVIEDDSGRITCAWFNQPYLTHYLKAGTTVVLYGKVQRYAGRLQFVAPEFEIISAENNGEEDTKGALLDVGRIVPVYTVPERMSQRGLRRLIFGVFDTYLPYVHDPLAYDIRMRNGLLNLAQALRGIHFPDDRSVQDKAYERLCFEEFFMFQVPLALRKRVRNQKQGIAHASVGPLVDEFIKGLPFELTADQKQVAQEIAADMQSPRVMQRLLQGDVGSGKTVVATIAALTAVSGGYQVAFMVPTEILARQHFEKITALQSSVTSRKVVVGLLSGSLKPHEKDAVYRDVKEGRIDLVIGTHALLEEGIVFKKLGLVVIDEQHKFGVGQRALLPQKGLHPDVLIMTATPIPRTLAITIYGDLDVSVIRHLPPGRPQIETIHVAQEERSRALQIAREQIEQGNQVFIIYPVIDESETLNSAGARKMYRELADGDFRKYRLGMVHGRMKPGEQQEVMSAFSSGQLDLLVATTVLEVGIDIPTVTCMIVEHAEYFGLSQLHQLRGRIGRGRKQSICVLVADIQTDQARQRIAAMVRYSDGFRIAQEDLKIRGPGEFFGSRQHGLTELKIGNPLEQLHLLKKARREALSLVARDPHLEDRNNTVLKQRLLERFPEFEKLMVVG